MSSHPPQEPPLAVTVARINPCQHFEMTRARESVWESACPAHRHPMPHFEPIGVYYNCTVVDDLMNKGDHYEEVYEALYKFTAVYKLPSPFCWRTGPWPSHLGAPSTPQSAPRRPSRAVAKRRKRSYGCSNRPVRCVARSEGIADGEVDSRL